MNYLKARQRNVDNRWDFTLMNDGVIRPVGYCAGWRDRPEVEAAPGLFAWYDAHEKDRDKYHTNGHDTPEEACACYRRYLLESHARLDVTLGDYNPCEAEGCETLTNRAAQVGGFKQFRLCDVHRTQEALEQLYPAVGEIIES